jgi:hypothetical protein
MAKRNRQLSLLQDNPSETRPLFDSTQFPYDTPDEVAYNAQRKRDGLFQIADADTVAEQQALENGTAGKS